MCLKYTTWAPFARCRRPRCAYIQKLKVYNICLYFGKKVHTELPCNVNTLRLPTTRNMQYHAINFRKSLSKSLEMNFVVLLRDAVLLLVILSVLVTHDANLLKVL